MLLPDTPANSGWLLWLVGVWGESKESWVYFVSLVENDTNTKSESDSKYVPVLHSDQAAPRQIRRHAAVDRPLSLCILDYTCSGSKASGPIAPRWPRLNPGESCCADPPPRIPRRSVWHVPGYVGKLKS